MDDETIRRKIQLRIKMTPIERTDITDCAHSAAITATAADAVKELFVPGHVSGTISILTSFALFAVSVR